MADAPADWISYADYLGLNEASLRELEDAAAQQGAAANERAQNALGKAYQEASADVERGGQGILTATANYGDYLKAQREAAQANAPQGTGYEAAARGAMSQGRERSSWTTRRDGLQGRLDERRGEVAAGKANVDRWNKDREAERDAQNRAFEAAKAAYDARTAQEESDLLTYSQGRGRTGGRQGDLVSRYGSVGAARDALKGRAAMQGRTAFGGARPYELNALNRMPR